MGANFSFELHSIETEAHPIFPTHNLFLGKVPIVLGTTL
jgi:hypothetical protein